MALSQILLHRLDGELTQEQEKQVGYIRQAAESALHADRRPARPAQSRVRQDPDARRAVLGHWICSARCAACSNRSTFNDEVELIVEDPDEPLAVAHRSGQGGADPAQPDFERAQVHACAARCALTRRACRRRPMRVHRHGHRHRHRAGESSAHLRRVHASRKSAADGGQGHRPRPAAVATACGSARRSASRWSAASARARPSRWSFRCGCEGEHVASDAAIGR